MARVTIATNRNSKTDEVADYLTIKIVPAAFVLLRIIPSLVISFVLDLASAIQIRKGSYRPKWSCCTFSAEAADIIDPSGEDGPEGSTVCDCNAFANPACGGQGRVRTGYYTTCRMTDGVELGTIKVIII